MVEVNLLVQTAYIGDLLLSIPLILRMRAIDPERKLVLLCRQGLGSFIFLTGLVDEIIEVNKKDKESWKSAKRRLKELRFRLVVCPHESFTSARLVGGLRARHTIGFKKVWNFWAFKERVARNIQYPEAIRQISLLQNYDPWVGTQLSDFAQLYSYSESFILEQRAKPGESQWIPDWASMSLKHFFSDPLQSWNYKQESSEKGAALDKIKGSLSYIQQIKTGQGLSQPYFCLAPGSVWATKRWTLEGYAALGSFLSQQGFKVVLLGAPDEKEICNQVGQKVPLAINLAGETTLFESALLLKDARALITNDCGAMHLGSVVEVPTIAVFGPTTLNLGYRPWQNGALVAQKRDLKCRPCGKHGPQKCPIGTHECMHAIAATDIVAALTKLLANMN